MRVKSNRKQAVPTHPPIHSAGLSSREPGLCCANNTCPALSLATDLTLPLLCRAAVQELAFLMLCLLMALDAL